MTDKTGLTGLYDCKLDYERNMGRPSDDDQRNPAPDLLTALEPRLGLKLVKTKVEADVPVIDHIDKAPIKH